MKLRVIRKAVKTVREFLARQSHNYKMMIIRTAGANFLFNLTNQYTSIYTKALGADNVPMVRVVAPVLGGFMYDSNMPWLIFAVPLVVDMLIRVPILYKWVPETLSNVA
ncbi:MAG: hypothetical protein ACOC6N_00250 [archaeon]